jgi:acetyl-CoA carboxylase biotin carboxylase subunit
MARSIRKILIANRGEIAVRVARTCREMGIVPVAVFSEIDRTALHVRSADEAYRIGPAPSRESYLKGDRIIDVARRCGADAIHPGYGFLSENAPFAAACRDAKLTFIGPPPEAIEAMGEKTRARERMHRAEVPIVPGTLAASADEAQALVEAQKLGFPVMLKAAAGGGGKGLRKVDQPKDFAAAWRAARSEAQSSFGDDRVYLEKYLDQPRHVEIQIFADEAGHSVYLGERECSVQRRHQKVIEESPSCIVDPEMRRRMGEVAVRAGQAVGYVGAGTIEFLVDSARNFYFLEMNTRLQVEHPVTEWCIGADLVRWQIEVARGNDLPWSQAEVQPRGHAIEARVYAEDPSRNFLPQPGRIEALQAPSGPGVRVDSGVTAGSEVSVYYDPMIAKLSVWAPERPQAIERLRRALGEYVVQGITTNVRHLSRVLDHADFRSGVYDTNFLSRRAKELGTAPDPDLEEAALLGAAVRAFRRDQERARQILAPRSGGSDGWRSLGRAAALGRGGWRR